MLIILFTMLNLALYTVFKIEKEKIYGISILLFVTICYISNEVLSVFHLLDYQHLFWLYLSLILMLGGVIIGKIRKERGFGRDCFRSLFQQVRQQKAGLLIGIFLAMVFVLAIVTVPYNWDSMTYHLPRLTQWVQNRSVAHYATSEIRQLTSPPLAEFINLQVYIFSGEKDHFLNLLQFFSYATNGAFIYFISRKLGAAKNYCWLAVLLFISMPIAFGEALNTQVDHFSTLWLLLFVYFLMDILQPAYRLVLNRENIIRVIILSSCIAYGYLAKPSIMFAIVFFALWLLAVCIHRRDGMKDVLVMIGIAALTIVLLVLPEVYRNLITFNAISAPIAGARQVVGTINPIYLLVNGIKNYAMNLPNRYFDYTGILEHGVFWISFLLGVEINHPSIAEDGKAFYLHQAGEFGHDTAINPVIVVFSTLVLIWLILRRIKREKPTFAEIYSWVAILAFLFFCLVLRWEPFVTRYMLSYLALLCPAVVIWLGQMKNRKGAHQAAGIIVFLCIVEGAKLFQYHGQIALKQNDGRDRIAAYFETRPQDEEDYVELKQIMEENSFKTVGLYLTGDTHEYPIWKMFDEDVRIENILVSNETARYANQGYTPQIIIVIGRDGNSISNYNGFVYRYYKEVDDDISIWKLE